MTVTCARATAAQYSSRAQVTSMLRRTFTRSVLSGGPGRQVALVKLRAGGDELGGLLSHPLTQCGLFVDLLLRRVLPHLLRDLHRAEVRAAHRAEVRELGALLRERLVVVLARDLGVEGEVELILPAELEARLRERVVAQLRARVPLGEVGRVRRQTISDDAVLHVLLVRKAQVLLRRDV